VVAQTIRSKEEGINTLMTATEVAAFLRVHLGSVRRWSRTGKLKGYRLGGRGDWRYDRRDVLAFLQHAQNS
jgi:excisionase family DNA binding protein